MIMRNIPYSVGLMAITVSALIKYPHVTMVVVILLPMVLVATVWR